jgi:hypothetical protein
LLLNQLYDLMWLLGRKSRVKETPTLAVEANGMSISNEKANSVAGKRIMHHAAAEPVRTNPRESKAAESDNPQSL